MKDNINIEELFKSKFENFEGNVDPSAWTNIQQGMNATGAGSSAAGLSGIAKVAIVSSVVAVTAVSAWYFSSENDTDKPENNLVENTDYTADEASTGVQPLGENILATDTNDPVIQQLVSELDQDLKDRQYNADDIDEELVESVLSDNNKPNGEHNVNNNNVVNNGNVVNNDNSNNEVIIEENKEELIVEPVDEVVVEKPEVSSNLKVSHDSNTLNKVVFKSNAKHHTNVTWDFGDGNFSSGDKVSHTYERPGSYSVQMTVNGTESSETIKRKVTIKGTSKIEAISNVITPNGDGRNDYLYIQTEGIETFYIAVINERGEEVYTSNDQSFEWGGESYDGTVYPGNYIITIIAEGEDGQIFKERKALKIIR